MGIRFSIFILMLSLPVSLLGQEKMGFAELDKKTFELYEKGSWKELKEFGQMGLDEGIDYYYLRMRIGIAEYKLNRYEKASGHFKKALEFNADDPIALEYLYYSLEFCGRHQEAKLLAGDIPDATRKQIGLPEKFGINKIFIEGGSVGVKNPDGLVDYKPIGPYVYHYLIKDFTYMAGGLNISPGSRLSLTVSFNQMKFSALQEGTVKNNMAPVPQYFSWAWQNKQTGFFLGSEFTVNPNWYLGLSGHLMTGNFNNYWFNGVVGPGQDMFTYYSPAYTDFVVNAELNRRFNNMHARLIGSYSDLGNVERLQPGLMLTWYPLGNLNLYLQAQADRIIPYDEHFEQASVFQALAGTKVFSKLWLEAHAAIGEMVGWSEKSGYIVYNNQDPILKRAGINLLFPYLISGLSLNIRCQLQQREHSWYIYNGNDLTGIETEKYLSTSLIGGLSWKF